MAAAYAFHIAENQPFLDGNKRTALNAAIVFLGLNGFDVVDDEGMLCAAMIGLSTGEWSKGRMAALLTLVGAVEGRRLTKRRRTHALG
jgi:death on curing protein